MSARKPRGFRNLKHNKEVHECDDKPNEKIGPCITDLPSAISIDILLRLPLALVLLCRCVCKTWRNLIKDSEFAKLHFSQAEAYPLIRSVGPTHVSRTLYFVDQPPKSGHGYDSRGAIKTEVNMKLDTKLKIPLNNIDLAMKEGKANMNLHSKRKRVTKLRRRDHKLNAVNSCNGFLCLSEPLLNNPVMVCNPITGEFINLPPPTQSECSSTELINCGLGFCFKTNQYKVIRMFRPEVREHIIGRLPDKQRWNDMMAEINTLGTDTWEMVGYAPTPLDKLRYCTYLNGALHWLYLTYDGFLHYLIAAFDFGKEIFQSIAIPPSHHYKMNMDQNRISFGQLRGCLCVSDTSDDFSFEIKLWLMKTYDDESSWTVELTINTCTKQYGRWLYGLYEPMSYFKDGTVLFFHPKSNSLFSYHPDSSYLKFLKVRGIKSKFEAISYIPSFQSLKDAMKVDGVEVYNIQSRCGGLKLQGESKAISMVEECADFASDWDLSD